MKQRGRVSEAALNVVQLAAKRVEPPDDLDKKEASAFRQLVSTVAPEHFTRADVALIVALVQATQISRRAADAIREGEVDRDTVGLWDRSTKIMAILSTRLRLAPQSRYDGKMAARRSRVPDVKPPWERHAEEEDD